MADFRPAVYGPTVAALGWSPTVTIEDGLTEQFAWHRSLACAADHPVGSTPPPHSPAPVVSNL